jgi:putative SOS response-associated peptidase YedK
MCANYVPVTATHRLLQYFGVVNGTSQIEEDVFPMGLAPFIRRPAPDESDGEGDLTPGGVATRLLATGIFRFVPDFVAKVEWARRTYNARSETVAEKRTFRAAWAAGQRCIIPAEAIYEPNYESGKPVRWRIAKASGLPMGIAGIYTVWTNPEGKEVFAMSMLTVNADDHPFMKRFHAPDHEKRTVVILEPGDFDGWLSCPVGEARERYCKPWTGELEGVPALLPTRIKSIDSASVPKPRALTNANPKPAPKPKPPTPPAPTNGELF